MTDVAPSARLNLLTLERSIPVSITIELTRRCPLSCRHCYLPETRGRARPGRELDTACWKKILDQLAAAGGLYLVFTGGEPLLRPDLAELCAYAVRRRFGVRVFSSGHGLTPELARQLKAAGVAGFEISFYGGARFHDGVTGKAGSYAASLSAAQLLKKTGIPVRMKVPLMKGNIRSAARLRAMARREVFSIAFDPVITAANDGGVAALALRLSRTQLARAVKLLAAGEAAPYTASSAPVEASPRYDFLCGAGRNICAIAPDGTLYPCLQLPVKLGNLSRRGFGAIWRSAPWLKRWRKAGQEDVKACAACPDAAYCSRCPGVSLVEEGDVFAPNKPACALAAAYRKLQK
ncbi:MAG: radical SAM protein [Elusimicrobia bacterium]|nr:radical SAM protein [Elusimicrobiota bacterium]